MLAEKCMRSELASQVCEVGEGFAVWNSQHQWPMETSSLRKCTKLAWSLKYGFLYSINIP